ncbi:hypothetical protein BESB_003940 [Besnoitia besnoiti]|uniref:Single-stranded DNA binding protein Ssb-like OB fold domain-containing protein n=1 Tax=Besnoitia besnoiti TaxID=94643 RepID=A0A2A9MPP2_BESBE|nr:hypothetical protein BESB_003940 [Besnoitia besnoiti]PFH38053.1 hypothetical protein BESB_003940 [Besnoitia besnoiti]
MTLLASSVASASSSSPSASAAFPPSAARGGAPGAFGRAPQEKADGRYGEHAFITKVADIQPGAQGLNCLVYVHRTLLLSSRMPPTGEVSSFAEVLVGDETGTIKLELNGEAQRTACRPGTTVLLRHASTATTAGELSLQILPRVGGRILLAPEATQLENALLPQTPCLSEVPLLPLHAPLERTLEK